jgi:prepilin-type N-terminal cleavage/methylation domain-containing protein/prepilin-type processing-associated H-X9-DG protein
MHPRSRHPAPVTAAEEDTFLLGTTPGRPGDDVAADTWLDTIIDADDDVSLGTAASARPAFTLIELLVVIAILAMLMGLLISGVQAAREMGRSISCANNLRQLAIAFRIYETGRQTLPPLKRLYTGDLSPQAAGCEARMAHRSWVPDVLPYVEEATLLTTYDLSRNWWENADGSAPSAGTAGVLDTPVTGNRALVRTQLPLLQCPSSPNPNRIQDKLEVAPKPRKTGACGDYFAVAGTGPAFNTLAALTATTGTVPVAVGVLEEWSGCGSSAKRPKSTLAKVTDGTSKTFLLAECAGREDVWRGRTRTSANADNAAGAACARAQGGAWATNDNAYRFGEKPSGWCSTSSGSPTAGPIPVDLMRVNGSNENGWLMYAFHSGGANVAMADASVQRVAEDTDVRILGQLATRAGGEAAALE